MSSRHDIDIFTMTARDMDREHVVALLKSCDCALSKQAILNWFCLLITDEDRVKLDRILGELLADGTVRVVSTTMDGKPAFGSGYWLTERD